MYKIKQIPEDFIVNEISKINKQENGQYAYYILKKINYTTIDALQVLAKKFKIQLKNFGFAGNKDKNAVTKQKISIFRGSKSFENAKLNNIELKYLGNGKIPISLGDLEGNEFTVTIRNLDKEHADKLLLFNTKKIRCANFFGIQRFSSNNHLVGKQIIKRDFRKELWKFDNQYNKWRKQEILGWNVPASVYLNKKYFNKNRKIIQKADICPVNKSGQKS